MELVFIGAGWFAADKVIGYIWKMKQKRYWVNKQDWSKLLRDVRCMKEMRSNYAPVS
jgi:hypothetical protein